MEDLHCEVIGCGEQSCWLLAVSQGISTDDSLCNNHWEMLNLQDPQRASRYTYRSSIYVDGTTLMAIVSNIDTPQ